MSSPSRKAMAGGSEQKRRSRLEHGGEKFSSPKSCSQFNIGQQSPRVGSHGKQAQSERYRPDQLEASQKDLNSTFGNQTYNDASQLEDEDCCEGEPRFGGAESSQQQMQQIHEIEDEEQDGLDYSEPADDASDALQEQQNEEVESEEDDLPVFGSQMKKKERRGQQHEHLPHLPGLKGSPRMSRSKSPEGPTINRIQTESFSDAYSDTQGRQSRESLHAHAGSKRSYNQYNGSGPPGRHRSRSVDAYGDADEDSTGQPSKRMRRPSDSGAARPAHRGGRAAESDSQSAGQSDTQLKFNNLSEFASI